MDLDLAIQNTLKRSPMEGAMHGVLSNFGAQYELRSYTENAGLAKQLFGDSLGITAPVGDAQLSKAVVPSAIESDRITGFSQSIIIGDNIYTVSHAPDGNNWELTQSMPATGWNKVMNWLRSAGDDTQNTTIIITKYGDHAVHRFLTDLETSVLGEDVKNQVASEVLARISPEVIAVIQLPAQTDMTLAGPGPLSAQNMNQSNVMEMELATEYHGVKKLRSDHFMGDTIIPTPISNIHSGLVRNAEGFNQDPVGLHIAPPTKLAGAPRKNSRSL